MQQRDEISRETWPNDARNLTHLPTPPPRTSSRLAPRHRRMTRWTTSRWTATRRGSTSPTKRVRRLRPTSQRDSRPRGVKILHTKPSKPFSFRHSRAELTRSPIMTRFRPHTPSPPPPRRHGVRARADADVPPARHGDARDEVGGGGGGGGGDGDEVHGEQRRLCERLAFANASERVQRLRRRSLFGTKRKCR